MRQTKQKVLITNRSKKSTQKQYNYVMLVVCRNITKDCSIIILLCNAKWWKTAWMVVAAISILRHRLSKEIRAAQTDSIALYNLHLLYMKVQKYDKSGTID